MILISNWNISTSWECFIGLTFNYINLLQVSPNLVVFTLLLLLYVLCVCFNVKPNGPKTNFQLGGE